MKYLNSRVHGLIDYALDFVLLIAPTVLGLSSTATTICYTVAALHFLTSVCTRYEYSLFKLIPFPVHGAIEFVASIALAAMPWIADFSGYVVDRNFFVLTGVALFAVWLTTNYGSLRSVNILKATDDMTFRKAS